MFLHLHHDLGLCLALVSKGGRDERTLGFIPVPVPGLEFPYSWSLGLFLPWSLAFPILLSAALVLESIQVYWLV